ncbi:MAG: autotransporter outer membrane beta-barrel domain-containing protein [Akkermansia sp.]|nr:autotransporter outer membrane beta-barrel domain-containing protein [Akkermansia sp.]
MKTRLPKMLLAALLAAMTSAYAADLPSYVTLEGVHQHYQGDPIVITDAAGFGSGISDNPHSTVSIGYGDNGGVAYNANFTLSGGDFSTPNALFIGGPGWPHTRTEGYEASKGTLTIDDGATLAVTTHISMGTCTGAESYLYIQGDSEVYAVDMQVSSGGGKAQVFVGEGSGATTGFLRLNGNLAIGVNNVTGADINNQMNIYDGSRVDVLNGSTSIGYAGVDSEGTPFTGGQGALNIYDGGTLNTRFLEIGIGTIAAGVPSVGAVNVAGTLNVTASEQDRQDNHETIIGLNGGSGMLRIVDGGTVNLGRVDVRLGSTTVEGDKTEAQIDVKDGGTLNHSAGTIYVGDTGTSNEETGDPNYGVGLLSIAEGATANLKKVEVSTGSKILVDGTLSVDETPDTYGIQGVRLYNGAILAGSPDNQGGKLTFTIVPENRHGSVVIDNFTLTEGTTLKACCDAHLTVGGGSTLTFDDGTLWLTDGIAYIDSDGGSASTITTTGSGTISVAGNDELNYWLTDMGSEKSGSHDKVALIDVSNFLDNSGTVTGILSEDDTLKLDRAGYEVRFSDEGVLTKNAGDGFRGFYVARTEYSAEAAYPTFNRNQRAVYDLIKQMEDDGVPIPQALKDRIEEVLKMDGNTEAGQIQEALDFLGAVNYSVMMHNQIEGNLSHQRMLRNRSMVGRNLRHGKGCTDLYAAGFYDNQRLKGDRSKGEGYRRNEWGGLIGGDTCINENLRLGADVALGWSNISPSHNMKLKQNSIYWDVYAQIRKGNWRSLTAVGMGIHNFKVERGWDKYTAKNDHVRGLSLNISEEISYDWKVNEKTTIQPFAAVDLSWNRIKGFTDSFANPEYWAMATHVAKQDAFIAEFTVGGRYIRDFACVTDAPDATWYFQLGVAVTAGDVDSNLDCNFVGSADRHFTVEAAERDRVGLDLGTGITIPVTQHWAVYGNAEVIFRGDSHNLNAQLGAQYAF